MTHFGGMGGITGGRPFDSDDRFERDVNEVLGDRLRADKEICKQMWSALANVSWFHDESGDTAGYSFRAAGDLIAAIRGEGDYMDWYCSGPYSVVSDLIEYAMGLKGWRAETDEES